LNNNTRASSSFIAIVSCIDINFDLTFSTTHVCMRSSLVWTKCSNRQGDHWGVWTFSPWTCWHHSHHINHAPVRIISARLIPPSRSQLLPPSRFISLARIPRSSFW
jgi:hypothetical protein